MPRRHDIGELRVFSDVLTFLYEAMLLHLPGREVEGFWAAHPFPGSSALASLRQTLASLEGSRMLVPADYLYGAIADAEALFCRQGLYIGDVVKGAIHELRHGHMLPVRIVARLLVATLSKLTGHGDLRRGFLRIAPFSVRLNSPNALLALFGSTTADGWQQDHVLAAPDSSFRHRIPPWDVQGVLGMVMQANPRVVHGEPYEEMRSLCHMRSLSSVAALHGASSLGPARPATLRSFLDGRDLELPARLGIPDGNVEVPSETRCCQRCGGTIAEAGSAYGSPCQILVVRYRTTFRPLPDALANYLRRAVDPPPRRQEALALHTRLMEQVCSEAPAVIRFDETAERLYWDEQLIARGSAARMLRWMLANMEVEGRSTFARQRLIAAAQLDPLNPSFELRIRRLMTSLDKNCPALRIQRAGRGLWSLACKYPFELVDGE